MNVGKNFIVGLLGTKLESAEKRALMELEPAGIILFKRNCSTTADWQEKLKALISDVRDTVSDDIFVSIDHEGGRVHRLPEPITHFPPANTWGDKAAEIGRKMGRELRALGINLNFAPTLDILLEQKNNVIGDRAFGTTADEVIKHGLEFIAAMEDEGVMACGKHFPGHGGTIEDSHIELPTRDVSLAELRKTELKPFAAAIKAGLRMIMTAHVLYPQIDPDNTATESPKILKDILRNELGFQGLIISDALEMKAISATEKPERAVKALNAGVDILLIAQPESGTPAEIALTLARKISAR